MPTTPYAKVLVSVNGGALSSGGLEVPSAATIALSPESTVGWRQQRWEIFDYPEGWTAPVGWSTGAEGVIFSTAVTPPSFTLPASSSLWGKWAIRLRINEQVADDQKVLEGLLDEDTFLSMLSPRGLRDLAARERWQFTTLATRVKGWLRDYQRNLRTLDAISLGSAVASALATGTVQLAGDLGGTGTTAAAPRVGSLTGVSGVLTRTATTTLDNGESKTTGRDVIPTSVATSNATVTDLFTFATSSNRTYLLRGLVTVQNSSGAAYAAYSIEAFFDNQGGVLTQRLGAPVTTLVESSASMDVTVDVSGTSLRVRVTGLAATNLRWTGRLYLHESQF
jgi:hypothetical protein